MELDLASIDRATDAQQPWPAPCVYPPLPPLDRGDLIDLQNGDVDADQTEVLAACAARSRGALDVAVGDGLAAMRVKDRLIRLGYSCLGDYAREVLGIPERTAQNLARLSRELRNRPLLRAAVCKGEILVRRAQTILPVAVGDAEAEWVDRAQSLTVRTLEMLVRAVRDGPDEDEEAWRELRTRLSAEERAVVDEALALTGKVLGSSAFRAQRLEAWGQEYIGGHPVEAGDDDRPVGKDCIAPRPESLERREAQLEVETQCWANLPGVPEPSVPEGVFDETASAEQVDAEVRRLFAMRSSWDDLFGHAALSVKESGIWRFLGFATFGHYCEERLGLSERALEQRVALERRLWDVPALREAYVRRQLSYEQARLLSRLPDADIAVWILRAQELTCIQLRRALADEREGQLRAAGKFVARLPASVALTLSTAFRAVRAAENPRLSDGRCLVALARYFLEVWKPLVKKRRTQSQRVRERDSGPLPGPGVQPEGGARAPRGPEIAPRPERRPQPGGHLPGSPPRRHSQGLRPRGRHRAQRARLGAGREGVDGAGALGEAGLARVSPGRVTLARAVLAPVASGTRDPAARRYGFLAASSSFTFSITAKASAT